METSNPKVGSIHCNRWHFLSYQISIHLYFSFIKYQLVSAFSLLSSNLSYTHCIVENVWIFSFPLTCWPTNVVTIAFNFNYAFLQEVNFN